ncbi:hypothetical protein [Streptomyces chrestomyceticus]|uniref:Uncharacterized protein n=1 Tax=Streptomyces chrestomyceticus TaxID=68185 RepID=A0ABU7WLH8_9ACTN
MSVTRRLALASASVTVGVGLAFAPAAQATDSGGAGIRSSHDIAIAKNAPLYGDVDGNTVLGVTGSRGSTGLSTCKRWSGYFQGWMYWTRHNGLGKTGYVGSWDTNLTHSHLNKCT